MSKPKTQYRQAPIDYRGAVLIAAGIGLSIFGLQQSVPWGWGNPGTWICIIAGLVIIGVFVLVEMRTASPLIKVEIFRVRPFAVENLVLLIAMMAFIPVFFFASEYAQIALHDSASEAGHLPALLLHRLRHRWRRSGAACSTARGPSGPWSSAAPSRRSASGSGPPRSRRSPSAKQEIWIIVAGAGMGMMLGPANTDAVNRAGNLSYGEATGITQTIRNYGASLGLAALGTILLFNYRSHLTTALQG